MQRASLAAIAGLVVHYAAYYLFGVPLLTEAIAEWIMARTPNNYSVWLLTELGAWAKPFAVTGGLATLGACLWTGRVVSWLPMVCALGLSAGLGYWSAVGILTFWIPAIAMIMERRPGVAPAVKERRGFLLGAVMSAGTAGVAVESYLRNEALAKRAVEPLVLMPFQPPAEQGRFAPPLVRRAVTSVAEFYGMSKNAVDPAIDPERWRMKITVDGKVLRELRYSELLSLPRTERYVTLRCVSNTLQSNLMGTALWSGVRLGQLVEPGELPRGLTEAAVIGVDGHADSIPISYAFGDDTLLALGMNGKTLNRTHGFPLRLLAPRYYGFKHVKWISEIRFVREPYFGTWPKMGYTKEPVIHTCTLIDKVVREGEGLLAGGIAFAATRGIRAVQVRAGGGKWVDAELEQPLSGYTWTRWRAVIAANVAPGATVEVEARAQDGEWKWQAERERPLFPDGMEGPTIRRVTL